MGHKAMKVPGVIVQLQVVLWSPSTSVISGDEDGDGDGDGLVWLACRVYEYAFLLRNFRRASAYQTETIRWPTCRVQVSSEPRSQLH